MATDYEAIQTEVGAGGIAFDYSEHLNLLNDLVERVASAGESGNVGQTPIDYSGNFSLLNILVARIAVACETMAVNSTNISNEITSIDNHLNRMQSVIKDIGSLDSEAFAPGPHVRNINTNWYYGPYGTNSIARAMMMMNLKETDKLDLFRKEITNPTPIP